MKLSPRQRLILLISLGVCAEAYTSSDGASLIETPSAVSTLPTPSESLPTDPSSPATNIFRLVARLNDPLADLDPPVQNWEVIYYHWLACDEYAVLSDPVEYSRGIPFYLNGTESTVGETTVVSNKGSQPPVPFGMVVFPRGLRDPYSAIDGRPVKLVCSQGTQGVGIGRETRTGAPILRYSDLIEEDAGVQGDREEDGQFFACRSWLPFGYGVQIYYRDIWEEMPPGPCVDVTLYVECPGEEGRETMPELEPDGSLATACCKHVTPDGCVL